MTPLEANPETAQEEWAELERLALAATPGPWASEKRMSGMTHVSGDEGRRRMKTVCYLKNDLRWSDRNAAFIAAANPSTVLALIAAARANSVGTDGSEAAGNAPSNPTRAEAVRLSAAKIVGCRTYTSGDKTDPDAVWVKLSVTTQERCFEIVDEIAARTLDLLPTGEGWRPIETAPKDGTEVIVLCGRKVIRLGWYFKPSSRSEGWLDENGRAIRPTHYMPLPPAPSIAGEGR